MLARPRRWIRAGWPWTSRSCTFGTVSRSASHAVLAPDLAIASAVMTRPGFGAFPCAAPARGPAPTRAPHKSIAQPGIKCEGRSTLRPLTARSFTRGSIDDGIRHDVLHRIHRLAVHPYLVVQVRSRGEPGRANERDLLPALHALATHHENLRAMGEAGHQPEAVVHRDDVAVTFFPPDFRHDPRGGRLNLRSHRRRHVDPLVRARQVENRVDALAHERAREPALSGHDRRRRGETLPVLGER